ncbi:hypothetical protein OA346_01860 [Candidatus Pelagibacter sp.]|nr:hypothetical protein [Candidatus Pelagibacter sp.]|tara:strand:+ start:1099 stop:1677 length:579 start_codon:yes stop_codon:yes gene_type:complete
MKKLYLYIIIILNWLNVCVANELLISANGIKLGDSALKYFDQNLIESKKKFIYKSDEYFMIYVQGEQINIRNNDPNYTIASIQGGKKMSFNECKKEINNLIAEIKALVPNVKTKEKGSANNPRKHWDDPSGKSLTFGLDFYLNESPKDGPVIRTNCTDWSSEIETSKNFVDHLGKTINLKEFNLFLIKMYSG